VIDFNGLTDQDCDKCSDDFDNCLMIDALGLGGGAGGIIGVGGAGPHHGPKGYQRPFSRCGKPTSYGRGIQNAGRAGIYGILFVAASKCFADLAGCMSGCQPDDHPLCMNRPPDCCANAPPSSPNIYMPMFPIR